MRTSLAKLSSPPSTDVSPTSIRSSVVLPAPFRPDSVIRSRRSRRNETPRSSGSPTMSLAMSEAIRTAIGRSGYGAMDGADRLKVRAGRPHGHYDPRRAADRSFDSDRFRPDGAGGARPRRRRGA